MEDNIFVWVLFMIIACLGGAVGILVSGMTPPKNIIYPKRKPAPIESGELWVYEYVTDDGIVIMKSQKRIDVKV